MARVYTGGDERLYVTSNSIAIAGGYKPIGKVGWVDAGVEESTQVPGGTIGTLVVYESVG